MRGKGPLLRPALDHLDKTDTIAVAHWCDNQTYKIDFPPSRDVDAALAEFEKLYHQHAVTPGTRKGELALQGMLRQILEKVHQSDAQPLPVIVFLYGDHSGMLRKEVDSVLRDLLETSVIVYGINDGFLPLSHAFLDTDRYSQPNVAHFLSLNTGGQYFSINPNRFATALDNVLVQVHFRYVLGFKPPSFDGKVHKLTVELSDAAKQKYPGARVAARPEYIPTEQRRSEIANAPQLDTLQPED